MSSPAISFNVVVLPHPEGPSRETSSPFRIEKSIPSFEARYTVLEDYSVELKYNIYNYDDYILWDRYYTANIVWINVAYDFDYGTD